MHFWVSLKNHIENSAVLYLYRIFRTESILKPHVSNLKMDFSKGLSSST